MRVVGWLSYVDFDVLVLCDLLLPLQQMFVEWEVVLARTPVGVWPEAASTSACRYLWRGG